MVVSGHLEPVGDGVAAASSRLLRTSEAIKHLANSHQRSCRCELSEFIDRKRLSCCCFPHYPYSMPRSGSGDLSLISARSVIPDGNSDHPMRWVVGLLDGNDSPQLIDYFPAGIAPYQQLEGELNGYLAAVVGWSITYVHRVDLNSIA